MYRIERSDEHSHILRLNLAGSPVEWLTWQEATTLYARELVTWTLGDTVRTVYGGMSRYSASHQTGRWLLRRSTADGRKTLGYLLADCTVGAPEKAVRAKWVRGRFLQGFG